MSERKACGNVRLVLDDETMVRCRLAKGHLGSHEGTVHNQRWWWNEHGYGIMRKFHPTTNKLLETRPFAVGRRVPVRSEETDRE